jgi:hypothetical protein
MPANAKLMSCHVQQGFMVFQHIPCIVSNLPQPDLLHTMLIGMLDHHQKWYFQFLKTQKWLGKYNAIWLSVPADHNLTPKNKSDEKVSQLNEKEMNESSQYLLGVETKCFQGGSPAQCRIINHRSECTWALLEFYMYA